MKLEAENIKDFIEDSGYTEIIEEIDKLLLGTNMYKDRKLHKTSSITLLGYGFRPYKNTCYDGEWPIISIAPQKNSLNLYVMIYKDGKSILSNYIDVFGKSNIGVSCIRIKKLNGDRIAAIKDIIKEAEAIY